MLIQKKQTNDTYNLKKVGRCSTSTKSDIQMTVQTDTTGGQHLGCNLLGICPLPNVLKPKIGHLHCV